MDYPIKVEYKVTDNYDEAFQWLHDLPDTFAADFETASKFTEEQKKQFESDMQNKEMDEESYRILKQKVLSNGLSHPSLTVITHLSVAWNDHESFVIICDNDEMRNMVTTFLVTTDKFQIWHNCIFDFKHIYALQHAIPKNFTDTMLMAKTLISDANGIYNNFGLKSLMAYAYGEWSIAKENMFNLENLHNEKMLSYAATDSPATYRLYMDIIEQVNITNDCARITMHPHDLLPVNIPYSDNESPKPMFFYNNVVRNLIPDIINLENHGIPINMDKVRNLKNTVDDVLVDVTNKLANNKLIQKFLSVVNKKEQEAKIQELESKKKSIDDFIKPFNSKNGIHIAAVVNTYLKSIGKDKMTMKSWTIKDLKLLNTLLNDSFIQAVIDKDFHKLETKNIIQKGMMELAKEKMEIYNMTKVVNKELDIANKQLISSFNPGSPKQKQDFFEFYGIESDSETAKGSPQFDRKELNKLLSLLNIMIEDIKNEQQDECS